MRRRRLERQGSQSATVEKALKAGMRLNQVALLKLYGGNKAWRLGGIVWTLQNNKRNPLKIERTYSGANRVATYWLATGEQSGPQQQELAL